MHRHIGIVLQDVVLFSRSVMDNIRLGCPKAAVEQLSAAAREANAEEFIPESSPFDAVRVNYERATYPFLAWRIDPVILYFIFTLIFALIFKPLIKVHI